MGGYARDLYHGLTARDIDVCIWGADEKLMLEINSALSYLDLCPANYSLPKNYGTERVARVIKTRCNVDLIFWGAQYKHWSDIIFDFDCNMSQYMLQPTHIGTQNPIFLGDSFGILTPNKGRITPVTTSMLRMERMEEVAINIEWVTSHEWTRTKATTKSISQATPKCDPSDWN